MIDLKLKHCVPAAFLSLLMVVPLQAAALKSAEITAIVNDVKVVNSGQGARPAKLQETISGQSSVQTGIKSRTELLFSDKTMARLGANSMFSFTNGTRDINLQEGTMMLQVPKGAGGAKITTAAVTAAITGTTIMIEYFPGGFTKVIVLEGTLRLFLNNRVGESTLLAPGKMIILSPNATQLPEPVDVDIKRLVKTSKLIKGIDGTDLDLKLVDKEIANQEKEKKKGDLIGTNLVITGSGTEVILATEELLNTLQDASFNQQELLGETNNNGSGSGGSNGPTSTKYNPVTTITNPNPYIINNTTTIVTDPTITTNGITAQGTLYNSNVQSGATSAFLFGSTSAFDTASGFDTAFLGQDYSVFRFSELQFAGTPTFNTVGGPKSLFLVSESNISTLPGSFPLDFSGLDFVGLATVDGYISLGSSITSITGPGLTLDFQARGANGEIFVDAPINLTGGTVDLYAETNVNLGGPITASSVNVRAFADITNVNGVSQINAPSVDLNASGNVTLYAGSVNSSGLTTLNVTGGGITLTGTQDYSGANANFNAGTSGINGTTGTSLLNVTTVNTTGNINFSSGGNLSATGNISANVSIAVGQLTASNVTAGNAINATSITSSNNIVSGTGGTTTTSGTITAIKSITSTGAITSGLTISAGSALQGTSISAVSTITGATIKSTSGDITSNSGNIQSTGGKIISAGNINGGGTLTSANDITAVGDITSNGTMSAIGIISGVNIQNMSSGNISAGGNISATGSLGTAAAGSSTTSTGQITAGSITGPLSGTSTFNAGTIVVDDVTSNSVVLNAPTVTINGQTSSLSSTIFSSSLQTLTYNGASAVNLALSGNLGSFSTLLTAVTTNANVTITGSGDLFTTNGTIGGSINTTGDLYANSMTVAGNLAVNQIKRTGTLGTQNITVTGTTSATNGLDFQGITGASGGKLSLHGSTITIGAGGINGANFVGSDSSTITAGGAGGNLTITSTSGAINLNSGTTISDHGGANTGGGDGGNGGNVSLIAATSANLIGDIKADGASGSVKGGNGGTISASANNTSGLVTTGSSASLNADGGVGNTGNGGNGGVVDFQATGSSGSITTTPAGNISVNGGNSFGAVGGNGGSILWKANGSGGSINHGSYGSFTANGGDSTGFNGGNAGTIDFKAENLTTQSSGSLNANGGAATTGNMEGGNGGTLNMTTNTSGTMNLNGNMTATTGTNSGSVLYGGTGGVATITGGGPVTISGIIKTSDDAAGPKMSKNGGKIQVTTAETDFSKPGITVTNTGQLLALLNAASVGKGGVIQFTSAGGIVSVAGTVDAGHKGQAGTSGTDGLLKIVNNGTSGAVNILNTATLRGDVVKAGAFGTNGVLTINGGGTGGLNADSQIKLYANSNTGTVLFTGGTINITSPSVVISANTVQVNTGTTVNTGAVSAVVYANNRFWNGSQGGSGPNSGTWSTTPTNGGTPASAPTF